MAVLNASEYRADVTTIEDTVLLRIEQDDLFEAMRASTERMQGVIGLLTRAWRRWGIFSESRSNGHAAGLRLFPKK